jgi:hypothetical protein
VVIQWVCSSQFAGLRMLVGAIVLGVGAWQRGPLNSVLVYPSQATEKPQAEGHVIQ